MCLVPLEDLGFQELKVWQVSMKCMVNEHVFVNLIPPSKNSNPR